jgi:hypothetical protein
MMPWHSGCEKDEFGLFIVSLTKGLCQRVRAGGQAEIGLTCLDNDKQELICACLTSGSSCFRCLK